MVCKIYNFDINSFFVLLCELWQYVALRYFTGFLNYEAANRLQNGGWPGLVERIQWAYSASCNENPL